MVADALGQQSLMAVARLESGSPPDSPPAVCPCVCVGYIVRHQALSQGRCNLLLQGITRARIVRECEAATGYRQAILEPIEKKGASQEDELASIRGRLEILLGGPLLRQLPALGAIHDWLADELPTAALVDLLALACCDNEADRYRILSDADPAARALWMENHLQSLVRTLRAARHLGPTQSEDGLNLN